MEPNQLSGGRSGKNRRSSDRKLNDRKLNDREFNHPDSANLSPDKLDPGNLDPDELEVAEWLQGAQSEAANSAPATDLKRVQLFVYLIPVLGCFPALWTLYRGQGDREQQNASRLAITLAMGWMLGYLLLGAGAQGEIHTALPLLILSSLLTSGYFLANIWLMVRLWRSQSLRLPGISRLSDRLP